jgi:hypothetical protein
LSPCLPIPHSPFPIHHPECCAIALKPMIISNEKRDYYVNNQNSRKND